MIPNKALDIIFNIFYVFEECNRIFQQKLLCKNCNYINSDLCLEKHNDIDIKLEEWTLWTRDPGVIKYDDGKILLTFEQLKKLKNLNKL
jgi:hypothetical protein